MRTFIVVGTDNETQEPKRMVVLAENAVAAMQQANARGMIATEVSEQDPTPAPAATQESRAERSYDEWRRLLNSPQHRAMQRAVFVGALQALVVFFLLQVALVVVWSLLRG